VYVVGLLMSPVLNSGSDPLLSMQKAAVSTVFLLTSTPVQASPVDWVVTMPTAG
jgi:hypothetical protein